MTSMEALERFSLALAEVEESQARKEEERAGEEESGPSKESRPGKGARREAK